MNTLLSAAVTSDFEVADLSLADWGRKEISLQKPKCQDSWQSG